MMPRQPRRFRAGSPILAILIAGPSVTADEIVRVRTERVEIEYETDPAAQPLDRVELWTTRDEGATWDLFGTDEDRHSPVVFRAVDEGPCGFFVVLYNATGSSSGPPADGIRPHLSAFVDYTPPVVQLHPVRPSSSMGSRVLKIRWTAIDAHLAPRPISIHYRSVAGDPWEPVAPEPLANTGLYDWRIPEALAGSVRIRVSALDRGGNQAHSDEQVVDLAPTASEPGGRGASAGAGSGDPDTDATLPGSARAKKRVRSLIAQAKAHRDRGDLVDGVARLREAVRLDPTATEAFTEMGRILLSLGNADRASEAFEIALQQQPRSRSALLGAALADRDRGRYSTAAERLRTILRYHPDDAEIWMALGDVAVFQGDELLARECYVRASSIDPEATSVIADAKQRLALMASVGRSAAAGAAPDGTDAPRNSVDRGE